MMIFVCLGEIKKIIGNDDEVTVMVHWCLRASTGRVQRLLAQVALVG